MVAQLVAGLLVLCSLAAAPAAAQAAPPGSDAEALRLLEEGRRALDRERLAEALALFLEASGRAGPAAAEAAIELQAIERRLVLEAAPEWLDARGNQIAAELGDSGAMIDPAVILTYAGATGKSVVPDVRIAFSFARGAGAVTSASITDAYGRASAKITRLDSSGETVLLRAAVEVEAAGLRRAPASLWKEFSYRPVELRLAVSGWLVGPEGIEQQPALAAEAVGPLSEVGARCLEHAPADKAEAAALSAGDAGALGRLRAATKAGFFALIRAEGGRPEQASYAGRTYNIFSLRLSLSFALMRTSDGRILHTRELGEAAGQGGSAEAARLDALRRARAMLGQELRRDSEALRRALEAGRR